MATATDLIAGLQTFITPDLVQQRLGTLVGETPAVTQTALKGAVPAMLGGILNLGAQPGGISQLQGLLTADDRLPENIGSMLGSNATGLRQVGQEILGGLFGGKLDAVVDSVAKTAGAKPSAVSSLLTLVAPLIMSVLGRQTRSQGLTAAGLVSLLATQRQAITQLIPASLSGLLGLPGLRIPETVGVGDRTLDTTRSLTHEVTRRGGLPGWWPWALALGLLLLAGLWYAARSVPEATRTLTSIVLPGGASLSVPETSLSYALARYLANPNDKEVPKRFVFDRLNFEPATTTLTADSVPTVTELSAIMKAYPAVTVALEGHTDNTGDPAQNRQLSVARANAVRDRLVQTGIAGERISTGGFGQDKPIASNDTAEGKARNRRTELVVLTR
jgi:outer membrane protein OmpA-like peptidoglycan-associated protein